jgi:hypothetical protein
VRLAEDLLGLLTIVKSKSDDYREILNLMLKDILDLADEHEMKGKNR